MSSVPSACSGPAFQSRKRPRRNRVSRAVRALVRETHLRASDLVLPLFVQEGENLETPIASLPGSSRLSIDLIVRKCEECVEYGVEGVALFPVIEDALKTESCEESVNPDGLLQRCVRAIKKACPELLVITDVALDPYSSQGHDGLVTEDGEIHNDRTLPMLAAMAVAQAEAGADVVAPSDMMDGRVGVIRDALDRRGFTNVLICSYAVKYASSFYAPFRDALDSAPKSGDKKTYQMDPANKREAVREAMLDEKEGADWLMVKPASLYLDVLHKVREVTTVPIAAYHVSGEYAMLQAAAKLGWLDFESVIMETLMSCRRAGADIIFTYAALEVAKKLKNSGEF
eukprot:CAMPEP_0174244196 /NCGR_PEP_ID=MMETSP0417-20130205/34418_1 /TAXON_ID=242541 /ORGANISM="Mayorella sp, Strain BSH-02190019" /LENGTH=342 /DNA_ID=CAMNT_0015323839 /DNA_START=96 /DNA_END=1124 /DNA_ORIENTATION=-